MNDDDRLKMAFQFAQDSTKQLIAFASGIIALTITFSKDFVGGVADGVRTYALWSWVFFLLSVFFGFWTLLALTGSLERTTGGASPSIYGKNVCIPAILQLVSFFVGLLLTVVFGFKAVT